MPIPVFDYNGVLPPHLGNPAILGDLSPYRTTTPELCGRFGNTPERRAILRGLLELRAAFHANGLVEGFQLLNGSFLQDIEASENRAPRDIDVITFFWNYDLARQAQLVQAVPELTMPDGVKGKYSVDHYFLDAGADPAFTVEMSQYWYGLFSHRRDSVWKGMLRIDLNAPADDAQALAFLVQSAVPGAVGP